MKSNGEVVYPSIEYVGVEAVENEGENLEQLRLEDGRVLYLDEDSEYVGWKVTSIVRNESHEISLISAAILAGNDWVDYLIDKTWKVAGDLMDANPENAKWLEDQVGQIMKFKNG